VFARLDLDISTVLRFLRFLRRDLSFGVVGLAGFNVSAILCCLGFLGGDLDFSVMRLTGFDFFDITSCSFDLGLLRCNLGFCVVRLTS
jgi:hypothetical protein